MFWLIWSLVTLSVIGNGYLYLKAKRILARENIIGLTFISLYAPRNYFHQLFLYVKRKTNLF